MALFGRTPLTASGVNPGDGSIRHLSGLQKVLALLVVTPSLVEVLAAAERLDLRDLSEYEIS